MATATTSLAWEENLHAALSSLSFSQSERGNSKMHENALEDSRHCTFLVSLLMAEI